MNWAMKEKRYSQRRACGLGGHQSARLPVSVTRGDDATIRARLRELTSEGRRFGYRRLHIFLKPEGVEINWKRLHRLYKEERLTVRKRGGRKELWEPERRWWSRSERTGTGAWNSDALVDGRRFRVLCVLDDLSRECLATVVDHSLSGERVGRELNRIALSTGYPCMFVSDNVLRAEGNGADSQSVSVRQHALAA